MSHNVELIDFLTHYGDTFCRTEGERIVEAWVNIVEDIGLVLIRRTYGGMIVEALLVVPVDKDFTEPEEIMKQNALGSLESETLAVTTMCRRHVKGRFPFHDYVAMGKSKFPRFNRLIWNSMSRDKRVEVKV